MRLLYAIGPGDVVASYAYWKAGENVPSETALTFSGQFFDFCRASGHQGYAVSSHGVVKKNNDGSMVVENRPKRFVGNGIWYHFSQLLYAFSIMLTAAKWRADAVIIDSGTTHWAALACLRLAGIAVIGNLHNTIWPAGFKPTGTGRRMLLATEGWFWRHIAGALLSVSPECERQVLELSGRPPPIALQYRGQFDPHDFEQIPPPPLQRSPFRVVFAGRLERNKGVFDIVEMASLLAEEMPGMFQFDICGSGPALDELAATVKRVELADAIVLHGRLNRPALLEVYANSHVVLVPTRGDFCEGFALVCAEAVLCGRPLLASSVVPAVEVLRDATVVAKTNDPGSYVEAIKKLRDDVAFYERLRKACSGLQKQFLDGTMSHQSALDAVFKAMAQRNA